VTRSLLGKAGAGLDGKPGASAKKVLGRTGEDLAVAWYEAHGYEVLARNWSCREGELDIVLRHGRLHVFCEVKARSSVAFGLPEEAVGHLKQARVRRLAALWFAELASAGGGWAARGGGGGAAPAGGPVRFDVAGVLDGAVEVTKGAF
jgi:putative endonuclease